MGHPLRKETWWSTHHAEGVGPHLDEDQAFPRTGPVRKVKPLVTLPWGFPSPHPCKVSHLPGVVFLRLLPQLLRTQEVQERAGAKEAQRGPAQRHGCKESGMGSRAEPGISWHPTGPGDLVFFRGSGRASVGSKKRTKKVAKLMRSHRFLVGEPLLQKVPNLVGEVFLES